MSAPYYYGAQPGTAGTAAPERFARDKFLLNQKIMSLGSKYFIYDEANQPLLYVDRPVFKIKAHIGVYADEAKTQKLLTIRQDGVFEIMNFTFTLLDERDQPIALFRRRGWTSLIRRLWHIEDTTGHTIAVAQEDVLWKALMRRIPYLDIIGDFLRTNFVITRPSGQVLGEFIRRFTLTDKYVMDVTADSQRTLDRRIVVALAVILDNAESR